MKKITLLFCLLSLSITTLAAGTYQEQLETYLKNNDWYVSKSEDENIFFQIFRDENSVLVLRTCPSYATSDSNGSKSVMCGSGLTITANSKDVTLNYSQNEKAFIGKLPGIFFDDKIILKVNSDRHLQMQLGDKVYLPHNAAGHAQISL